MKIRILLADDHKMLREALRLALERDPAFEICGEAADGGEAVELAGMLAPDIVVMDVGMPVIGGADATRAILMKTPGVKVLALSAFCDEPVIRQMLDAGASGYVSKLGGTDELGRAIRAVADGRTFLCPSATAVMVDAMRRKPASNAAEAGALSQREFEVLRLLAEGKTSPEIARILNIATSTANAHRRNIMRTLDLHSVAQLTKYAISRGIARA